MDTWPWVCRWISHKSIHLAAIEKQPREVATSEKCVLASLHLLCEKTARDRDKL